MWRLKRHRCMLTQHPLIPSRHWMLLKQMEPERFYHKSITMAKKKGYGFRNPLISLASPWGFEPQLPPWKSGRGKFNRLATDGRLGLNAWLWIGLWSFHCFHLLHNFQLLRYVLSQFYHSKTKTDAFLTQHRKSSRSFCSIGLHSALSGIGWFWQVFLSRFLTKSITRWYLFTLMGTKRKSSIVVSRIHPASSTALHVEVRRCPCKMLK